MNGLYLKPDMPVSVRPADEGASNEPAFPCPRGRALAQYSQGGHQRGETDYRANAARFLRRWNCCDRNQLRLTFCSEPARPRLSRAVGGDWGRVDPAEPRNRRTRCFRFDSRIAPMGR